MASITSRILQIRQPYGGFINPCIFHLTKLKDNTKLSFFENVSPNIAELAVKNLTRYMTGSSAQEAFSASLNGASLVQDSANANELLHGIRGLNENAIICACKLAGYDECYLKGTANYKPIRQIDPNPKTIHNIKNMIKRSLSFWDIYGPVIKSGFSFEGGYTFTITAGNGDYLTSDTLWEFLVSKKEPTNIHTLQLLICYILGQHSIHPEFQGVSKLGIFNPRLNNVYLLNVSDIDGSVIETVSKDVICYGQH